LQDEFLKLNQKKWGINLKLGWGIKLKLDINQTLRDSLTALPRHITSPYVFWQGEDGKRFMDVRRSFRSALKRAGIKDFRFHDLRHTFASHLIMKGADITTVKELLGHRDIKMTMRYAHLADDVKKDAVKLLDEDIQNETSHRKGKGG
jgi:integrase